MLASIHLNTNELLNLKGTPLPQDANFDELRLKDIPAGTEVKPGQRIVIFKSASGLRVQPLDHNGRPKGQPAKADKLQLDPKTVYYLVTRAS